MNSRRALVLLLSLVPMTIGSTAFARGAKKITLSQLQTMFDNMRAKTKWNVEGPLLWGYFFVDPSEEKLKRVATDLVASGYRMVEIEKSGQQFNYRLHVEKVEEHTPMSLYLRNGEFYTLAEKYGLASYDGMDVGPTPIDAK